MAYSVFPMPGGPRMMNTSRGNLGRAATFVAYRTKDSRGRAPSCVARSLRKIVLASCAMHSSLPFFTAAAMEASLSSSSSLSSPMVTVGRGALGLNFGGRGASSLLTSALTPRPSSCFTGGPEGGRGPSCPASVLTLRPGGMRGAADATVLGPLAPNSCLTMPPFVGGCEGGWGMSPSSSFNSALIAMRSAWGANFLRKTRNRSSCPRRILTAALASTMPERARTNSWYCSTLPHSTKRALTAARKVEAEISSCSVGSPTANSASPSSSRSCTTGFGTALALALAFFWGGASSASSNFSCCWASCALLAIILSLNLSEREAGTGAASSGLACQCPARDTCFAPGASVAGFEGGLAGASLALGAFGGAVGAFHEVFSSLPNRDGCDVAVGNSA
mmetsp:Transcript_1208/g.3263  ORF Transcript_1208/g.3263 Transcript_1208/m.3263 type:complete len:392 (+) Transcript_1208:116-1291(+)